ncbi:Large eukaryotic DNA virus major capsid protein [uncultured virus]|nr:Large eukaryotic DNA virus major capsid protein [uncultured virus]
MTGGILQLVAKGIENIFLTNDPEITFFKMIYRRHTNFSKVEIDLNFSSPVDFGKIGLCKLKKLGDLLHRLILIIELPKIQIISKKLTIFEIKTILKNIDLIWETNKSDDKHLDQNSFEEIEKLINNKNEQINEKLSINKQIRNLFETGNFLHYKYFYEQTKYNPDDNEAYFDYILERIINYDNLGMIYRFIEAVINDNKINKPIVNAKIIKNIIFENLKQEVFGNDNRSFNDENLIFLNHIENLIELENLDEQKLRNYIAQIYHENQYKHLDSYKIFNNTLNFFKLNKINNNIKQSVINNIENGLVDNIILLKNLFQFNCDQTKFIFVKLHSTYGETQFNNISAYNHQDNILSDKLIKINFLENNFGSFSEQISNDIKQLNIDNLELFRDDLYNKYFDKLQLLDKTNIEKFYQKNLNFENMLFLNLIPLLTIKDIPIAINRFLKTLIETESIDFCENLKKMSINLLTEFNFKENKILSVVETNISKNNEIYCEIFNKLDKMRKTKNKIIISILCPNNKNLIEYITDEYKSIINSASYLNLDNFIEIKYKLNEIINLFITTKKNIPNYDEYVKNNYNINKQYQLNNPNEDLLSDVLSSIWYNVSSNFNKKFYSFFDKNLGKNNDNFGVEMTLYSNFIKNIIFCHRDNEFINNFFDNKIRIMQDQLKNYEIKKQLLNFRFVKIPKEIIYADMNSIVNFFKNKLVKDNNFFKQIVKFLNNKNFITIKDFIDKLNVDFKNFYLNNNNPFDENEETNKYNLWNNYFGINNNKYNDPYDFEKSDLSNFINLDDLLNNNIFEFKNELDILEFIKKKILEKTIDPNLLNKKTSNAKNIYENFVMYFDEIISKLETHKKIINKNDLIKELQNNLKNQNGNFAWVEKIGHKILDFIEIKIDNKIIDKHYGHWLEIWHQLTKKKSKEQGYNILIGNIPKLTKFNSDIKEKYELMIPLQFWFCKTIGSCLPLISLQNSEIEILVKFEELENVIKMDKFDKFYKKPKLNGKLIGEFIYLENEERNQILKKTNEYLIDILEYNEIDLTKQDLIDGDYIEKSFELKNPCKELIWSMENKNNISDLIDKMGIKFNKIERESLKESIYYNLVQPYERHNSSLELGTYLYSFSLFPEKFQPSGAANLNKLNSIELFFKFKNIDSIKNFLPKLKIYSNSYEILRIIDGTCYFTFNYPINFNK